MRIMKAFANLNILLDKFWIDDVLTNSVNGPKFCRIYGLHAALASIGTLYFWNPHAFSRNLEPARCIREALAAQPRK